MKKYIDIVRSNSDVNTDGFGRCTVAVLSNIMLPQLADYIRYGLYAEKIAPSVTMGDYDNIVQDSEKYADYDCVIIFWELCSLVDFYHAGAEYLGSGFADELIKKIKSEISYVLNTLRDTRLVVFNRFSNLLFADVLGADSADRVAEELNAHLKAEAGVNVCLINIEPIIARLSVDQSVGMRDFYSSKALYTTAFFELYAEKVCRVAASHMGRVKKALIFDCDNTLWKGIVGEDDIKIGGAYAEVQYIARGLAAKGILIGLCSKNNPEDVEAVLSGNKDMILRNEDIAVKRVNWNDKAANLSDMAKELNIGLDSFVFVDDSDFECSLIMEKLPQVTVIKVPEKINTYPSVIRDGLRYFYGKRTAEDAEKTKMYRQESERKQEADKFSDIEDYLASLNLCLTVYRDCAEQTARLAQLTQKTNQFNFTTRRYTESEIKHFIDSDRYSVFSFELADKFGDYGVTGMLIVEKEGGSAVIDTFLMSCRVLGRRVELSFISYVMARLRDCGAASVSAEFIPTAKNAQVSDFWDRTGLADKKNEENGVIKYVLSVDEDRLNNPKYIKIIEK